MYKKLFLLVLTFLIPIFSFAQTPPSDTPIEAFSILVTVNQAIIDHNARNVDIFYQVESRDREYSDLRVGVEFLNINDLNAPALYTYFPNQSVTLSPRVPKESVLNLVVPESLTGKVTPRLVVYGQNDFLVASRDMGIITLAPSTYKKVTIESCEAENKKATCVLSRKLQSGEVVTLTLKQGGRSGSVVEVQKTTNTQSATLVFNFAQELSTIPNPFLEAFVSTADTKLTEAYFPITGKILYQSIINVFSGEKIADDVRFSVLATRNYSVENETLKVTLYDPSNKVCDSQEKPFTESIQTFDFAGKVKCNAVRALATISKPGVGKVVSARQVYTNNLFVFEEEKPQESPITNNFINTKNMILIILIFVALGLLVLVRRGKAVLVLVGILVSVVGSGGISFATTTVVPSGWGDIGFYSNTVKAMLHSNCSISITVHDPIAPGANGTWSGNGSCVPITGVPANRVVRTTNMPGFERRYPDGDVVRCNGSSTGSFNCSGGGSFTAEETIGQHLLQGFSPAGGTPFTIRIEDSSGNFIANESVVAGTVKPGMAVSYTVSEPTGVCRNGIRESSEQCDDGAANTSNEDGCTRICRFARCGDGYLRTDITNTSSTAYEQCDAGSLNGTLAAGCDLNCRLCSGDECLPQRYTCAGGCVECGGAGQPACINGSYTSLNSCQTVCTQGSNISCGYIANPTSATVGQTIGLELTTQYPVGGLPGSINGSGYYLNVGVMGCEYNRTPNTIGEFNTTGAGNPGYWTGLSNPLVLGANSFNAKCMFRYDTFNPEPEPEGTFEPGVLEVQCLASTVTGSAVTQGYRCGSCSTAGAACASGEPDCYDNAPACTTTCAAPTAINIGWANGAPLYDPKNWSSEVGQLVPNLEVTIGSHTSAECTLSGSSGSTFGTVSSVNSMPGYQYGVPTPPSVGSYTYTLNCAGETVTATLTMTAFNSPTVTCNSPQTIVAGQATFNWSSGGFSSSPTCTVDGASQGTNVSGSFTRSTAGTSNVVCTNGTQTAAAQCVAQNQPLVCGDGICSVSECGSCIQDCANSSVCTDNAACINVTATPNPVVIGRDASFTISAQVQNIGNSMWTNLYKLRKIDGSLMTTPGPLTMLNPVVYPGEFRTFSIVATTPSDPGSYGTRWQLEDNAGNSFGAMCPAATLTIPVVKAECVNGSDDDKGSDVDCGDPQCNLNGVSGQCCDGTNRRPLWNSETAQCGTATNHTLTANPQLIRQGGTSILEWKTGGASDCYLAGPKTPDGFLTYDFDVDKDGTMDGWTITDDGRAPVSQIQNKLTYQLFCSGVPRSATIAVIKINEV